MSKYHGKNSRVYVDGYNLSGYSNAFEIMNDTDVQDTSAFEQSSKSYVTGLADDSATLSGFYDDEASIGAHQILTARIGGSVQVMFDLLNIAGGPGYAGSAEFLKSYNVQSGIAAAVSFTSQFVALGSQGFDIGNMVIPRRQFAGTPAFGSMDGGAASTAGARVYLQNFGQHNASTPAAALGSVVVQHGTDSAFTTPVTLVAFGSMGTAPSVAGSPVAGTVHRYVRVVSTSGSPHIAVMIKRL